MVPVCGSPANGMSQSAVASPWHGTGTEAESPAPAQPGPGLPGPRSPRPLLRAQRQDGAVGSCGAPGPAARCPPPEEHHSGPAAAPGAAWSSWNLLQCGAAHRCPSLPRHQLWHVVPSPGGSHLTYAGCPVPSCPHPPPHATGDASSEPPCGSCRCLQRRPGTGTVPGVSRSSLGLTKP